MRTEKALEPVRAAGSQEALEWRQGGDARQDSYAADSRDGKDAIPPKSKMLLAMPEQSVVS